MARDQDKAGEAIKCYHEAVAERLATDGFAPEIVKALLDLDSGVFQWHRLVMKGEVLGKLIEELGLELDLSHFYAMTAILRLQNGFGREAAQVTVGLLAEEMDIDPSRASRIASDLIGRGYVRREAAQDDGRKSILVLTDAAWKVLGQVSDQKWSKMGAIFEGWSEDEITTFSRLFLRYIDGIARVYRAK
jgi:DNA-binding MarR family transcriptional regulator